MITTDIICWTRMQVESGEALEAIVARKEAERLAGDGLFAWGVGNASSRLTPGLVRSQTPVDLIFSVMRSRPRPADTTTVGVVRWTRFVDDAGVVRDLPPHLKITSRGAPGKTKHFALFAKSDVPLAIGDLGPMDHSAWRNAGEGGGPVGASQVTAILQRWREDGIAAGYRIAMRARLAGPYWAKLVDPVLVEGDVQ